MLAIYWKNIYIKNIMCQNFNASTFLLETSKSPENTCPHQQDDSSLPLKTRQEHPAQHLWQIFYYIYLLKDINKWKGLWFKPGNSAFIAEAIRRLFLGSHHSPSANFAMQKSPLRGAKDPSTGGWAAISPRMLSIRFSSLVPAEMRKTKRWTSFCKPSRFSGKSENIRLAWLNLAPRSRTKNHPDGVIEWFIA